MLIAPKRLKLRTSNLTCMFSRKGAWPGSRDPVNFWALNTNTSKTVKVTVFKFDVHVSRDSPDIMPLKCFEKGAWSGSRDPLKFWALNANTSKMVKVTVFKFDVHVSRNSLDMTP